MSIIYWSQECDRIHFRFPYEPSFVEQPLINGNIYSWKVKDGKEVQITLPADLDSSRELRYGREYEWIGMKEKPAYWNKKDVITNYRLEIDWQTFMESDEENDNYKTFYVPTRSE